MVSLTEYHIDSRLQWAVSKNQWLNKTYDSVIFSDESQQLKVGFAEGRTNLEMGMHKIWWKICPRGWCLDARSVMVLTSTCAKHSTELVAYVENIWWCLYSSGSQMGHLPDNTDPTQQYMEHYLWNWVKKIGKTRNKRNTHELKKALLEEYNINCKESN